MIDLDIAVRLIRAQQRLFRCIEDELREDGHHKSYEGSVDLTMNLPNFFEQQRGVTYVLEFHCYLLCDGRHESFTGKSVAEVVSQFERYADKIAFPYEMRRFEKNMMVNVDDDNEAEGGTTYGAKRGEENDSSPQR